MHGLQWGREQLLAETKVSAYGQANQDMLQWGREQLLAETTETDEPLPEGVQLQWGREQLLAETPPRICCSRARPCCFNGAASNCSRKRAGKTLRSLSTLPLQWGREQLLAETTGVVGSFLFIDKASM